jgi:alkanesulfonate monooxygenase SsuD/methylene tetrahydromethanopterin reductase-like flavin-dependent oxidoreductase (luciferase family)
MALVAVSITDDVPAARAHAEVTGETYARLPAYRAVLDREGVGGPQDVVIVGDEDDVAAGLQRLRDAGVSEFMAAPFGTDEEQQRTTRLLAELVPGSVGAI